MPKHLQSWPTPRPELGLGEHGFTHPSRKYDLLRTKFGLGEHGFAHPSRMYMDEFGSGEHGFAHPSQHFTGEEFGFPAASGRRWIGPTLRSSNTCMSSWPRCETRR